MCAHKKSGDTTFLIDKIMLSQSMIAFSYFGNEVALKMTFRFPLVPVNFDFDFDFGNQDSGGNVFEYILSFIFLLQSNNLYFSGLMQTKL